MHEYSVAASLRRMVEERALAEGASRVVRVVVRVGQAAGIEPDLLATAWAHVRRGGPCDRADLLLEVVPARWVCALCRAPVPQPGVLRCAACGVAAVLDGGDELVLQRLELEVDGAPGGASATHS